MDGPVSMIGGERRCTTARKKMIHEIKCFLVVAVIIHTFLAADATESLGTVAAVIGL